MAMPEWWRYYCRLPHAVTAPQVLKFARWRSVESCWGDFRPQTFLANIVLRRLPGKGEAVAESTDLWNCEAAAAAQGLNKSEGLLARCARYIDLTLVDHMDIFTACTKPLSDLGASTLIDCKTPSQGRDRLVWEASGGINNLFSDVIEVMYDLAVVVPLIGNDVHPERRDRNVVLLFDQTLHTASETIERLLPPTGQWPGRSGLILVSDNEEAACSELAKEHMCLIAFEREREACAE